MKRDEGILLRLGHPKRLGFPAVFQQRVDHAISEEGGLLRVHAFLLQIVVGVAAVGGKEFGEGIAARAGAILMKLGLAPTTFSTFMLKFPSTLSSLWRFYVETGSWSDVPGDSVERPGR